MFGLRERPTLLERTVIVSHEIALPRLLTKVIGLHLPRQIISERLEKCFLLLMREEVGIVGYEASI
jgi:hypothetical protein